MSIAIKHNGAACSKLPESSKGWKSHRGAISLISTWHLSQIVCPPINRFHWDIECKLLDFFFFFWSSQGTVVQQATHDLLWHSHSRHLIHRLQFDICHRCIYQFDQSSTTAYTVVFFSLEWTDSAFSLEDPQTWIL